MIACTSQFECLLDDEVFLTGAHASTVDAMWRSLVKTPEVSRVARDLGSDRARIEALCSFVDDLLLAQYDKAYRHPHDIAICAALVVLERCPLSCARNLFARLRDAREPSLTWGQRMAEYCERRFVPCNYVRLSIAGPNYPILPGPSCGEYRLTSSDPTCDTQQLVRAA